jgi:pimeloyl-ACP methyl ester carboxylesterase
VLIHGAFADASSFGDVIPGLIDRYHLPALAPAVPNRALNSDAAYVRSIVGSIDGPVLLVGHSYGCAVATVAGTAENVVGLVYLAGFVPDEGESLGELAGRFPETDLAKALVPTPVPGGVDLSVGASQFAEVFAADVDPSAARVLAITQRPLSAAAFDDKAEAAAWRTKPAWGLIATSDHTINPEVQRFGYARANVASAELDSSHLVMLAHPTQVLDLIGKAAQAVAG